MLSRDVEQAFMDEPIIIDTHQAKQNLEALNLSNAGIEALAVVPVKVSDDISGGVAIINLEPHTYTLEEVGKIFKVTRERVRQIEAKAVRKLQHPIRSRMLEGFLEHISN